MKKSVKNERGLSPVVASTLMILLVLVLAAMIFLWARGFISEHIEKFGNPIEAACASIDFKAEKVGTDLHVINRGDIDIRHLDVMKFDGEGNSEVSTFGIQVDAGGVGVNGWMDFEMSSGADVVKTVVYPALIGKVKGKNTNKVFTCMDAGVTL